MTSSSDFVASFVTIEKLDVQGRAVYVRSVGSREWISLQQKKAAGELIADYVIAALGLCDEKGVRIFENAEDLADLPPHVATEIAVAVMRASKLISTAEEAEAKN